MKSGNKTLKLPFIEHLKELRTRLIKLALIYLVLFVVSFFYADDIYLITAKPLIEILGNKTSFIYTGLTEAFFTYLNLSAKFAFLITIPIIAYQIYKFVEPGLYKSEKNFIKALIISSPLLFFIGVFFVYFFVMPKAFEFFISFQSSNSVYSLKLEAKIDQYISLVTSLIVAFGIAFQLPIIILILVSLNMVASEGLKLKRRFAIVGIFIVAGIITPPDIISQLLLAFPLMLLYELTIIIAKRIELRRNNA